MHEFKARKGLARGIRKRRLGRRLAPNHPIPKPLIASKARAAATRHEKAKKITDPWEVLRFVLMSEKCVRMVETENMIVFIANRKADKFSVAHAFENVFGQKVASVRTLIDQKGRKKAFVKLKEPGAAGDIAIKLGII